MNNGFSGESVNFITDEEAIKEIDIGQFLDKASDDASVFEGFQEDIERTEKSLESALDSLYDDIVNSGPATIVPKPLSVITSEEPEKTASESGLEELWMNPEEYFDLDIPVVSLDDEDETEEEEAIPEEAFFRPEPTEETVETEAPAENEKTEEPEKVFTAEEAKDDLFGMIDSMKTDSESESGFGDILAEIEANTGIAEIDTEDFASVADLLSTLPASEPVGDKDKIVIEPSEETVAEDEEIIAVPEEDSEDIFADPVIEVAEEETEAETDEDVIAEVVVQDESEAEETEVFEADSDEISIPEETADTDSEEFRMELERLLGGDKANEEKADEKAEENGDGGFVVNIPDDGNDYSFAENQQETEEDSSAPIIYFGEATDSFGAETVADETKPERVIGDFEAAQRAALEATAEETKEEKKARKKKEKEEKKNSEKKKIGAGEIVRRIVLSVAILVIIASGVILANTYIIQPTMAKKLYNDTVSNLQDGEKDYGNLTVDTGISNQYDVTFPEGMLAKYAPLYASNQDLRGWISIPAFEINLPVVQGTDNNYYLKRNIYKKWTEYGVPFFDFRIAEGQFATLPRNTVIYGHNMRSDDLIFGMLEEYRDIDGYKRAPVIECNTIYGDFTWLVCGAFISNSNPAHDNGYVFPYNFIDCSDQKFMGYISELEKRRFYDTGVDLAVTDKILTLSTCCYDFPDARLVVVARLLRDGESVSVDTSKAIKNPDPKGPQVWFDENGRPNNYAYDARW